MIIGNRIIPQPIEDHGWNFFEKCRCGGTLKYKFKHPNKPDMLLIWMPTYRQFKIQDKNITKIPVTKIEKLQETLPLI